MKKRIGLRIAFLGMGLMGAPMARQLLDSGFDLTVWNRNSAKAVPLAANGAKMANSALAAVQGADLVISMLSDGQAVQEVMSEAQSALKEACIWVDMSSTKPDEARAFATLLQGANAAFLDAPVSGGTKGAAAAALAIMVGGDAQIFAKAQTVLSAMGRPVHVGPVGAGQLAKLANQAIVGVTIGAVAEAMLLLERGGADPAAVRQALKGGFADSIILQQHGARMSARDFTPGGLSHLQLKDLDNVLHEASGQGLTLPMVAHIRDRFHHYVHELDGAQKDHSGLFEELLARNPV